MSKAALFYDVKEIDKATDTLRSLVETGEKKHNLDMELVDSEIEMLELKINAWGLKPRKEKRTGWFHRIFKNLKKRGNNESGRISERKT